MEQYKFLAFDLGAESGRAVLGTFAQGKIALEVIHRFRTEGLTILGTRQWDYARIFEEMCTGLAKCVRVNGPTLDGIGVDTWGVDFGLIAPDGAVLANPRHYRDKRNEGMHDYAFTKVPREELYKATGIQFLPFNSVYQLLSMEKAQSPLLEVAESVLLMGDLFGYLLSGKKSCEYTNASTSQLLNPWTRTWDDALIARLGLPRNLLLDPVPPGTVLGTLLPEVAAITGADKSIPVIAPGTHDTASAVAAVPVEAGSPPWAYLSSGTWSLLGAELDEPCINDESLRQDFTNEGGVGGKIRFLKNIFGLWLVQECRRAWEREDGQAIEYTTLNDQAAASPAFVSLINLEDPRLLAPENMVELIQTLCRDSGQPVPTDRGAIVRCALESLALKYRQTLSGMDQILGRKTEVLHIIGGGTQNTLLCQMTADACGIPVIAGPIEATALGNIGVQAMAIGALASLEEMRAVIACSVKLETYEPRDTARWDALTA